MTLAENAFVSLDEAKAYLLIKGTDRDAILEDAINRVSDFCEAWCQLGFKKRDYTAVRCRAQWTPRLYLPAEPIDLTAPVEVLLDGAPLVVWRTSDDGDRQLADVLVGSDHPGWPNHLYRAAGWIGLDPEPVEVSYTGGQDPISGELLDAFYQILAMVWREQLDKTIEVAQATGGAGTGSITFHETLVTMRAKQTLDWYRATRRV